MPRVRSSSRPVVDFFLAGAPKAGTSALGDWLSGHPDVFMIPKDQQFFASDLKGPQSEAGFTSARYEGYLAEAGDGQLIGDASTGYLYSAVAARAIHDYNPDARILLSLRDPVDAIRSLYLWNLRFGNEDLESLDEALAAEPDRLEGRRIPPRCHYEWCLQYRAVYRYGEQLRRLLDVFSREQVHVILFDDLRAEPERTLRSVHNFLGIDPDLSPPMDTANEARQPRLTAINSHLLTPPTWLRRAARGIVPRPMRRPLFNAVLRLNSRLNERAPSGAGGLAPTAEAALRREFEADVDELAGILGRDLTGWTQGGRVAAPAVR